MAGPSKFLLGIALLEKIESSYGGGGSVSASTDGILLEEPSQAQYGYANDGARPMPAGTFGYQRRVVPSGPFLDIPAKVAVKGAAAAYSASVVPVPHTLLRLCGLDAAVVTTPGTEKWTYTPTPGPTGYASGVGELYVRGQKYPHTGALGDFTLTIDGPGVAILDVSIKALASVLPSDVAAPTVTYPSPNSDPPKAVGLTLTLGSITTLAVRKLVLKMGREITQRLDVNAATGHGGFAPGARTPQLEITYETAAAATFDPYTVFNAATYYAWSFQVGSVQYSRFKLSGPQLQLMGPPKESADGKVSLTTVTCQLNPSAQNQNDELSWVFD